MTGVEALTSPPIELALSAYFFFASAASDLVVFLNLPDSYPNLPSFKDMGETGWSPRPRRHSPVESA
jgi:hypothetical protein